MSVNNSSTDSSQTRTGDQLALSMALRNWSVLALE
jgi:hypothetical protein